MERSVNKVFLVGRLGKDAETKFTSSGVAKSTFSLATSRRYKKGEEWVEDTTWHNIVLWRAEKLAEYLTRGKQVHIEGRIETRSYDDKNGDKKYITEIVADNVILLGGDKQEQPVSAPRSSRQAPKPDSLDSLGITDDDSIPF